MSLREDTWRAIEGRAVVTGRRGAWDSRCELSSGSWSLRLQAAISGLLHLEHHHPRGTHD